MTRSALADLHKGYDPAGISIGVVHFGPGAFHRAHQGDYFDRLLRSDPRWGIAAVSLRSAGTIAALRAQQGCYSLSILDREPSIRVLAPHRDWIGPGKEARLRARLIDPRVRLVTATVTEKGYCLDIDGALVGIGAIFPDHLARHQGFGTVVDAQFTTLLQAACKMTPVSLATASRRRS